MISEAPLENTLYPPSFFTTVDMLLRTELNVYTCNRDHCIPQNYYLKLRPFSLVFSLQPLLTLKIPSSGL